MTAVEDNYIMSQLFKAVQQNDRSQLMEFVLSSHCDPREIRNEQRETLLHFASQLGHLNMIRTLVEVYQCKTSVCDNNNHSPTDCAYQSGHLSVVLYFKIYDLQKAACSGNIPLVRLTSAASQFGNSVSRLKPILFSDAYYIICKHLGAMPFENPHSFNMASALSLATCKGSIKVTRLILDELANGMFIHSLDSFPEYQGVSSSLIKEACRFGHNKLANYLIINKGLSVLSSGEYSQPNQNSQSSLVKKHIHRKEHSTEEAATESKRADNHVMSQWSSTTAIHSIVRCGNFATVKNLFLACHYNDDQSLINEDGDTLLHAACVSGRLDTVQFLVDDMKCDINSRNKMGNTPLHVAVEWGSLEVAMFLLEKGCTVDPTNELGQTPFYLAIMHERNELCYLLYDKNVNVNIQTTDSKESPLHIACCCTSTELATLLLKSDKQKCQNVVDAYGDTPLFNACRVENADLEMIRLMITKGCDSCFVNGITKETPVHIACRRGRIDIIQALLSGRGQEPVNQCNYVKMSLLHLACYNDDEEMTLFLLTNHICEVNSLDTFGLAPLHIAAIRNMTGILKLLLQSPCYSNVDIADERGSVSLHHVCKREVVDKELVMMLANDATITHRNDDGCNPLHFICDNNCSAVSIQCLLSHPKVTLENKKSAMLAVDLSSNTPLHLACKSGRSVPVELFIRFLSFDHKIISSAVLQENQDGNTPLHLACLNKHVGVINCMLGHPKLSDECICEAVVKQNKLGATVLHIACLNTKADVFRCILSHLKEDTVKLSMLKLAPNCGRSPLHLACEESSLDIVTCFLGFGFNTELVQSVFHVLSANNDSLLHAASKNSESINLSKFLVEQQLCNVMHQNDHGDTALHIACRYRNTELALFLCESKCEPHCLNKNGESPVHLVLEGLTVDRDSSSLLIQMIEKGYCNWNDLVERKECHKPNERLLQYMNIDPTTYCYTTSEISILVHLPLLHSVVRKCYVDHLHISKFMNSLMQHGARNHCLHLVHEKLIAPAPY